MEEATEDFVQEVDHVPDSLLEQDVKELLEAGMEPDLIVSAYGEQARKFLPEVTE